MAEIGNTTVTWAERMELLKDSAQQRAPERTDAYRGDGTTPCGRKG